MVARPRRVAAGVVLLVALTACGGEAEAGQATVRLGYFPNLTHATPIVGLADGHFAAALGSDTRLATRTFNAGPAAVEALFSGAVDAAYVGPNPTVNAFVKSRGAAVRVIAGAASGGAFLVVKPDITTTADLRGRTIATPQLGNTQDVALRHWLRRQGFTTTKEGGGDVHVVPQENGQTVDTFRAGEIDGAWVPEPFASRLVEAGGRVLVDERSLWPGGRFVVTNLVVRTEFLERHPAEVKRLLAGHVAANAAINADPARAQRTVSQAIGRLTGKPLDPALVARAWPSITFLDDPVASSLAAGAEHAEEVGLLEHVDLDGLYDLTLLNEVLAERGRSGVRAP